MAWQNELEVVRPGRGNLVEKTEAVLAARSANGYELVGVATFGKTDVFFMFFKRPVAKRAEVTT